MWILGRIKHIVLRIVLASYLRILALFIKVDKKVVLFSSFTGKAYSDNPKYIYEFMRQQPEFADYQFIWALQQPRQVEGATVIRYNSLQYYYFLTKAKYWVFNAKMAPYYYKRSNQVYLQTWHGTPLKRLAHDIIDDGKTYYRTRSSYQQMVQSYDKDSRKWDYLIATSPFSKDAFSTAFRYPKEKMLLAGYPRVAALVNATEETKNQLKKKYQLPKDKRIILYAPTWRDDDFGMSGYNHRLAVDFALWKEQLGEEFVVLFKPHYLIANHYTVPQELEEFVFVMDAHADINDAYLVSDILITDYSSVFFDFAVLNRPIYFYMYDFEKYQQQLRGFYLTIPEDLPNEVIQTERELLEQLKQEPFDYERLTRFNQRFNPYSDGQATEKIVKEMIK